MTMKPLEIIAQVARTSPLTPIVDQAETAWARAEDLIIGVTTTDPDRWKLFVDAAYQELENAHPALGEDELWSIVLIVHLPRGTSESCARSIEHDLRGSRKIAFIDGEDAPRLFGTLVSQRTQHGARPIAGASVSTILDEYSASAELRDALSVLVKQKRPREEVERLIDLLGGLQQ